MVRVGIADVRDLVRGERDHGDPDRKVHEEDPLPAERLRQRAADERPDCDPDADRGTPVGDRLAAGRAGELLGDQRERGREHRGAADALDPPRHVEEDRAGREAAEERGEREDRDAADEDPLAPEAVGERPLIRMKAASTSA